MKKMMNGIAAAAMAAVMTMAFAVTGFAAENPGFAAANPGYVTPAGMTVGTTAALPEFRFTDGDAYLNPILDYMKSTEGQYYDKGDVMIPNFVVLRMDASDPDDVKVWGDFSMYNYDLQGDNLFCKNGGSNPGLFHMKSTSMGYTVTAFDKVGDGSDYTPDVNRIFGTDQALLEGFWNLDHKAEVNRLNTIRGYVLRNNLPVNSYQDYGWDKVSVR